MNKLWLVIITIPLVLSGCGNPVNRKNAENYHQWGLEAEWDGNYQLAERSYSRALVNAQLGHSPDVGVAMASYNLGRVKGYLCKDEEAEKLLLESLVLEEKITGPKSPIITKRLFELARFYYDHAQYLKSEPYYSRAISMVREYSIEKSDPVGLANAIKEYSIVLKKLGKNSESGLAASEAETLKKNNPGKKAGFVPVRYNQCGSKSEQ